MEVVKQESISSEFSILKDFDFSTPEKSLGREYRVRGFYIKGTGARSRTYTLNFQLGFQLSNIHLDISLKIRSQFWFEQMDEFLILLVEDSIPFVVVVESKLSPI